MTAEELLRLPERDCRYELVRGELRSSPFAGVHEGSVTANFLGSLMSTVSDGVYSRTGFRIERDPDTVLAPNGAFVLPEREIDTDDYYPGPPDLAFEVISWNRNVSDVEENVHRWLSAGVRAVIVANTETCTVRVHRPTGITDIDTILQVDDVVPGWQLSLSELFA